MAKINELFDRIEKLTQKDGQSEFLSVLVSNINKVESNQNDTFTLLLTFVRKIMMLIDELSNEIKNDDKILISVKNQKLLRTCFQLITSLGVSSSLIPGLGVSLSKRCLSATVLPPLSLTDEQKYKMLVECTNFFIRSYEIPVLKNIIITLHLSDYLAALIQLSFAPLKKPGIYKNFLMTTDMYKNLLNDRQEFIKIYESLVKNCFQPILMKELLVLQSVTEPLPPTFVKRVISKELSQRLLAPGGLLSLIRCFIDSYNIDTGFEWKKIDMICKIITAKHGNNTDDEYLNNITIQLSKILLLTNTHYLATAVACVLSLNKRYPESEATKNLVKDIFSSLDYEHLISKSSPGTLVLTMQEVDHKINILHACACTSKLDWPASLLMPNFYTLFLIGVKSSKAGELNAKVKDILLKSIEKCNKIEVRSFINTCLFRQYQSSDTKITIDEYHTGIALKAEANSNDMCREDELSYFVTLFEASTENQFIQYTFEVALDILIELSSKRQKKTNKDLLLLALEEDPVLVDTIDEQYALILQLLSEISTSSKVIALLRDTHFAVLNFIEHFISKENHDANEECITIALVLMNTILSNSRKPEDFQSRFSDLIPTLKMMSNNESTLKHILCKEALSLMSGRPPQTESKCSKAISDVFDHLLPVRAHGLMELTKLIDAGDVETISKKHYILCLLQEQLKDSDSYIYLSAVNGLAALGTHCTEDVLHVLCKEFLQMSSDPKLTETRRGHNEVAELRMKIGDIIVKITRRLGEMAVVHKALLLNTMLCGCRDPDPLARASALSGLAEIALVLNYKMGSIIYEVLLCIWSILETDKAVECRRAALMVITSLIKGLGKETLMTLKENLLPIYRTLKNVYGDPNEDSVLRLHAQLALEELNDVVNHFLFPELKMEKQIFVLDDPGDGF